MILLSGVLCGMAEDGGRATQGDVRQPVFVRPSPDARERFKKIINYECYYGGGQAGKLSAFDAVIISLDGEKTTPKTVADIKSKRGALVIGYITIGEDDGPLDKGDGRGPGGFDSRYLDKNKDGKPDRNKVWRSHYVNAGNEGWIKRCLAEVRRLRGEFGVDGLFLDTLDTVDVYPETAAGMVKLVRAIRESEPSAVLAANRGFRIIGEIADLIDGVMFESFTATYDFQSKRYRLFSAAELDSTREWAETVLLPLQRKGLVILALDYAEAGNEKTIRMAFDRAVTFGFVPCVSNIKLDRVYEVKYTGRKDDRWLRRQSP
ncbi:MAG: endo alpha-1,4 polygalactosaminidase [Verrucomicrobiae bacterium]|nr:endo alpha-1,4 polygalactosaminidase [Verrucomicrobiae bacterium]